jgi:hypothetical protein
MDGWIDGWEGEWEGRQKDNDQMVTIIIKYNIILYYIKIK